MDVEIDGSSRVLISPELRAAAGLAKDVMLLGMGSHFELWDAQRYAAHEAEAMQQDMPDVLQGLLLLSAVMSTSPAEHGHSQHPTVLLDEAVDAAR